MAIASEPTPLGGVAGPVTKEYVPVSPSGSSAHGPGPPGATSPLPVMVVVVPAAAAGAIPVTAMPAVAASIAAVATNAPALLRMRNFFITIIAPHIDLGRSYARRSAHVRVDRGRRRRPGARNLRGQ